MHRIISALPGLSPQHRLVVIGRGHARGALQAHADYLGVRDRVEFLGAVDDLVLHRWMRTASVLVTLKEESLWGGTLLLAACAGTPVVASDIPANREAAALIGRDGVRFVSRRASPFAVADAIREQALAGSRPHPTLVPTWEQMAESTVGSYHELLATRVDEETAA
jgi:glycosyltransferase involved in cell wall biosynthesis